MDVSPSLLWFRLDLRLADNAAPSFRFESGGIAATICIPFRPADGAVWCCGYRRAGFTKAGYRIGGHGGRKRRR